jgi:hypothetical protein
MTGVIYDKPAVTNYLVHLGLSTGITVTGSSHLPLICVKIDPLYIIIGI